MLLLGREGQEGARAWSATSWTVFSAAAAWTREEEVF